MVNGASLAAGGSGIYPYSCFYYFSNGYIGVMISMSQKIF